MTSGVAPEAKVGVRCCVKKKTRVDTRWIAQRRLRKIKKKTNTNATILVAQKSEDSFPPATPLRVTLSNNIKKLAAKNIYKKAVSCV